MYFTARDGRESDALEAGAIGFATSLDLYNWTLQEPVFTGGCGELEVPQVFEIGGKWYCLFCTSAKFWGQSAIEAAGPAQTGTHYLISESAHGPWKIAPGPMLDGADFPKRYAARIEWKQGDPYLLGFRWFDERGGDFVGKISDPDKINVTKEGLLYLAKST